METICERKCRKLKVEPQDSLEDEDESIRKLEEETNLVLMNLKKEHLYEKEHETSVQLSFKLEVEEGAEIDKQDAEIDKQDAEIDKQDAEIYKQDAGELVSRDAESFVENNVKKEEIQRSDYSILVDASELVREADEILKSSTNPIDKALAIETKNLWGKMIPTKFVKSKLDIQIQEVLNSWARKESQYFLLCYKCYICFKAWWFLHPFREHVKKHKDVIIHSESINKVTIIIAQNNNWYNNIVPIAAQGSCFRCNKDFNSHLDSINEYKQCDIVKKPKAVPFGLQKCTICMYTAKYLDDHYIVCHTVRSDVVMDTKHKICTPCQGFYFIYSMHECKKRHSNMFCKYCRRHFGTGRILESHMKTSLGKITCKYCDCIMESTCMEPYHLVEHVDKFIIAFHCDICSRILLFPTESALKNHMSEKHFNIRQKRKTHRVIVPSACVQMFSEAPQETSRRRKGSPAKYVSKKKFTEIISLDDDEDDDELKQKPVAEEVTDDYERLLSRLLNSSKYYGAKVTDEIMDCKENIRKIGDKSTVNEIYGTKKPENGQSSYEHFLKSNVPNVEADKSKNVTRNIVYDEFQCLEVQNAVQGLLNNEMKCNTYGDVQEILDVDDKSHDSVKDIQCDKHQHDDAHSDVEEILDKESNGSFNEFQTEKQYDENHSDVDEVQNAVQGLLNNEMKCNTYGDVQEILDVDDKSHDSVKDIQCDKHQHDDDHSDVEEILDKESNGSFNEFQTEKQYDENHSDVEEILDDDSRDAV